MNYGALLRRSWTLAWRHRFLWVLALFAGGSGAQCGVGGFSPPGNLGNLNNPGGTGSQEFPRLDRTAEQVGAWLTNHIGLILLGVALVGLIVILLMVIGLVFRGAIARATTDLALGRPSRLGSAWAAGCLLFWRYFRLSLLLIALTFGVLLLVGVVIAIVSLSAGAGDGRLAGPSIIATVLLGLLGLVLAVPLLVGFGIVVTLAHRAIAVESCGAVAALRIGYRLLRANLGRTLLAWLLSVVVGIGLSLAFMFGLLVLVLPLGIIGALIYFGGGGFSAALIGYGVLAIIIVIVVLTLAGALANAFSWSYWSLVYLRLSGALSENLTPVESVLDAEQVEGI